MRSLLRGPGGRHSAHATPVVSLPLSQSGCLRASEWAKIPQPELEPLAWGGGEQGGRGRPRKRAPLTLWTVRAAASYWATWASRWLPKSHSERALFSPELYESTASLNTQLWSTLSPGALDPRASFASARAPWLRPERAGSAMRWAAPWRCRRQALRFAKSGCPDWKRRRERELAGGGGGGGGAGAGTGTGAGSSLLNHQAGLQARRTPLNSEGGGWDEKVSRGVMRAVAVEDNLEVGALRCFRSCLACKREILKLMAPSGLPVANTRGQRCPRYKPGLQGWRCGPRSHLLSPLLVEAQAEKGPGGARKGRPYTLILWPAWVGERGNTVADRFGLCLCVAPPGKSSGSELLLFP